jgi:hypothetical protein
MSNRLRRKVVARFINATYDPESWYYDADSSTTLQEIIDRWQTQRPGQDKRGNPLPRQKMYDRSMPLMLSVRDLWPLREYTWTRSAARGGYAQVGGKSVWLDGPMKWDALLQDMKNRGWDKDEPLYLNIGREGGVKVGEGNHRLAIAKELGLNKVPVWFIFNTGKVTKTKVPEPVEVEPEAVKEVIEKPRRPRSPKEEKEIQELAERIMKLF